MQIMTKYKFSVLITQVYIQKSSSDIIHALFLEQRGNSLK